MKNRIVLSLIILLSLTSILEVNAKDKDPYRYELEATGLQAKSAGYVIVKVWNYGRKETVAADQCLASCIEGLMFKGYIRVGNDQGKKPLLPDGRDEYMEYVDNFIKSGDYKQFVQLSNNGEADVIRLSNSKEYKFKVGMIVVVNYKALKDRLERDGLLKSARSVMDNLF